MIAACAARHTCRAGPRCHIVTRTAHNASRTSSCRRRQPGHVCVLAETEGKGPGLPQEKFDWSVVIEPQAVPPLVLRAEDDVVVGPVGLLPGDNHVCVPEPIVMQGARLVMVPSLSRMVFPHVVPLSVELR